MIDQLKQMAIFAKAIDHGSFRGAADELNLSPSVVSHHISQLEDQLGVALIYRSTRKLALTNEGQRLLGAARNMLAAAEDELRMLTASAAEPSGEIRVTLPSVLSLSQITDQIAAFSVTYPRIKLTVDFSDTRRSLIEDGFDLAIRMGPNPKNSATTRKLSVVNRVLVASKAFLSSHTEAQEPSEIIDWDWLVLAPVQKVPMNFQNKSSGKAVRIKPTAHMFTNDAQALHRLARAGAGLAIVPDFLVADDLASGKMALVLPNWQLPSIGVFAEWPANAPKHGLVHLLLNSLTHRGSELRL